MPKQRCSVQDFLTIPKSTNGGETKTYCCQPKSKDIEEEIMKPNKGREGKLNGVAYLIFVKNLSGT